MSEEDERHGESETTKKEPDEVVSAQVILLKIEVLVDLAKLKIRRTLPGGQFHWMANENPYQREGE